MARDHGDHRSPPRLPPAATCLLRPGRLAAGSAVRRLPAGDRRTHRRPARPSRAHAALLPDGIRQPAAARFPAQHRTAGHQGEAARRRRGRGHRPRGGRVSTPGLPTIGIYGAGKAGTALARLTVAAGHRTLVTGSPRGSGLDLLLELMVPRAEAVDAHTLARQADVVVLLAPFSRRAELPLEELDGKIVVDA